MIAQEKPTILVVDDEPDILFSLQALLRNDFDVRTAEVGAAALDLLALNSFEVIMTDQRMPGMTGVELLWRSRQICPHASRIIMTGYADLKATVEAINRGQVFRYLTKPWDPDELTQTLRDASLLHRRTLARQTICGELNHFLTRGLALADTLDTASGVSSVHRMTAWDDFLRHGTGLLERLQMLEK